MLERKQLRTLRAAEVPPSGNRVAVAIRLSGLTQRRIASDLRMTEGQLSDISRGRFQRPRLDTAQKLAVFFGCQTEDLFPIRHEEPISA